LSKEPGAVRHVLNRDVFQVAPEAYRIPNDGVAKIVFPPAPGAPTETLKDELRTFRHRWRVRPRTAAHPRIIPLRPESRRPEGGKPENRWEPRQVLLFSGHRVDAPDRKTPRFPADKEAAAAQAIEGALERLGAGSDDVSFSQAASGGDLLFVEACQKRGVRCRVLLPFDEPEFVEKSIVTSAGGDKWRDRFYATAAKLLEPIRIMTDELGPLPANVDPFERCNLWLMYSALACGMEKLRFIALWDGGGGDDPGGTAHTYSEVKRRTGRVVS
jgi:hypothetical protein